MSGFWKRVIAGLRRWGAGPKPQPVRPQPAKPQPAAKPQPPKKTPATAKPRPAAIPRQSAVGQGRRPESRPAAGGPPTGRHLVYAPQLDGQADPGEIVWHWVAYEDDPSQGKDRPVLVVGRDGNVLLGLMLSSQRTRDGEANWHALGPGTWDREARPSWVRLDRVIRVPEQGIRREGAVLDQGRFESVAAALRAGYGWS